MTTLGSQLSKLMREAGELMESIGDGAEENQQATAAQVSRLTQEFGEMRTTVEDALRGMHELSNRVRDDLEKLAEQRGALEQLRGRFTEEIAAAQKQRGLDTEAMRQEREATAASLRDVLAALNKTRSETTLNSVVEPSAEPPATEEPDLSGE